MKHFYLSLKQLWCDVKKVVRGIFVMERREYSFERVVFVFGIVTGRVRSRGWRKQLERHYSKQEVIVPQVYYFHTQT